MYRDMPAILKMSRRLRFRSRTTRQSAVLKVSLLETANMAMSHGPHVSYLGIFILKPALNIGPQLYRPAARNYIGPQPQNSDSRRIKVSAIILSSYECNQCLRGSSYEGFFRTSLHTIAIVCAHVGV